MVKPGEVFSRENHEQSLSGGGEEVNRVGGFDVLRDAREILGPVSNKTGAGPEYNGRDSDTDPRAPREQARSLLRNREN